MSNLKSIIIFLVLLCVSCKNDLDSNSNNQKVKRYGIFNQTQKTKETIGNTGKQVSQNTNQMNRDGKIIGVWRHTEVISSGSGEFYASMTTDDFVEFRENGSVATWVGDSMAGNVDMTFESNNNKNVQEGLWNTNASHNQVLFTDPVTKQEVLVNYYLENNNLMFSNGNNRKIYEKIN